MKLVRKKQTLLSRNPYWTGRISTFDLLVLTSSYKLLSMLKNYFSFLQNELFWWGGLMYWAFSLQLVIPASVWKGFQPYNLFVCLCRTLLVGMIYERKKASKKWTMNNQGETHIMSGINTDYLLISLRRRLREMSPPQKPSLPWLSQHSLHSGVWSFTPVQSIKFCNIW
jgi:hypothetical protein